MNVNQTVLDAIELLANSKVEKANYNTTIQAQIISCEDASIGKYRCRYQDAIIYAYSNNIDTTYTNGSYVNILVPGNDMSKDKTILGSTTRSGVSYISELDNQAVYDINGTNCININDIDKFYLNTLNRDYKYTIYQYGESSDISLDDLALAYYIRRSSSIKVAATFKTSIAPERQTRGHYGITYNLRFLDNTSNQEVIRSYTINEDNMKDNPYRLAYGTEQSQYFKIDGQNFIRIESIEIFNKEFPGANGVITDRRLDTGDIEITNLKFFGTSKLSESELNGLSIFLSVPEGLIFKDDSTTADYKTITAKVRIKGKEVAIDKNFSFYWGRENNQVMANNRYYNKHLGRGWQCLNQSNIIDADPAVLNDPNAIIEWVPAGNIYKMSFTAATASDNKIKVVVVYNGNTASKQVNIKNLCTETPQLTIESSNGTKFYYDIGHPTLTCKINGTQPQNYHYYWAYVSDNQVLEDLPETTSENTAYTAAVTALTNLQDAIASGTKFENAQKDNLTTLQNNVKAFNSIQRVEGNKIYNVQINDITDSRTFKCTVVNENGILLGTPSITLENTLSGEDLYSLVINNGTQVFQYNENGVAPNSKSLDSPQEILPLSFAIYDNLGQPIQEDILENINNCRIKWEFPKTNTMLVDSQENGLDFDEDENYRYYDDKPTLFYNISQRYYIQKQRNQIKLTVRYKGLSLSTETSFTFAKQGEPGTNGTEYIVKLIPNTAMSVPPLTPMITKAGNKYILNYGLGTSAIETELFINNSYKFFKAQLWHSGELVWEGNSITDTAQDNLTQPSSVIWSILKNKYNNTYSDTSAFEIVNTNNGQIRYTGDHLDSNLNTPLANIIKCSIDWEGKTYYGTVPIVTAWTSNENYRVKLKDYTGFRYVMYTSDGISPQYDDANPFEFICEESIDNTWEDISLVSGSHAISYEPSVIGNYLSKDGTAINSLLLEILSNNGYEKNQCVIRPKSKYDGLCVNNAVCCIYKQNNVIIGKINVPIHFLLNKYGLSHINAWDGNSVQIDNEGGFILTPQAGAGHKHQNDNGFTGVLMGDVKMPDKDDVETGLMGFSDGTRSFFLNSQNGSAIFGSKEKGQLVIDPSNDKALIYSGNFFNDYNEDGLPSSYVYRDNNYQPAGNAKQRTEGSSTELGDGMIIDLTTPEIYYGRGNFYVNKNGQMHAEEGDVAGWNISKDMLSGSSSFTDIEKGPITSHTYFYSGERKLKDIVTLNFASTSTFRPKDYNGESLCLNLSTRSLHPEDPHNIGQYFNTYWVKLKTRIVGYRGYVTIKCIYDYYGSMGQAQEIIYKRVFIDSISSDASVYQLIQMKNPYDRILDIDQQITFESPYTITGNHHTPQPGQDPETQGDYITVECSAHQHNYPDSGDPRPWDYLQAVSVYYLDNFSTMAVQETYIENNVEKTEDTFRLDRSGFLYTKKGIQVDGTISANKGFDVQGEKVPTMTYTQNNGSSLTEIVLSNAGGTVEAFKIGNMLLIKFNLTNVIISQAYVWTNVFNISMTDLGIINGVNAANDFAYITGGGPAYNTIMTAAHTDGCTAGDAILPVSFQVNQAMSDPKFLRGILIAVIK